MEIDYNDPAVIAIQNTTPNAGCTIDGQFYDVRNLLATIALLTAERDQARAEAAAAYERAADTVNPLAGDDHTIRWAVQEIRALATEAENNAHDRIVKKAVDAETRACAEVVGKAWGLSVTALHKQILARLDQRKEAGE